jgi:hypothetical protein
VHPGHLEPREIAGHARDRYVYAPCDGVFRTKARIGDAVRKGEQIAEIGSMVWTAPLDGVLRGLSRDGVPVSVRTKVIEVDPRSREAEVRGIGERPRRIAAGVAAGNSDVPFRPAVSRKAEQCCRVALASLSCNGGDRAISRRRSTHHAAWGAGRRGRGCDRRSRRA